MKALFTQIFLFIALPILIAPALFAQNASNAAITFREPSQRQSIYAFTSGISGRVGISGQLYVNHNDSGSWTWEDLGKPSESSLRGTPNVISFLGSDQKGKIYAFVRGEDDQLYVAYKTDDNWRWANQGKPNGVDLTGNPSAITYKDQSGRQRIYVFVPGENGRLYVNYWDGFRWRWADQGRPGSISVSHFPISAITYEDQNRIDKIYTFVVGRDGNMYVNYWDGFRWNWANQGRPSGSYVYSMNALSYRDNNNIQRIYTFVSGSSGRLSVNYWDGYRWRWADQGAPPSTSSYLTPSVISFRDNNGRQNIYAFVNGSNNKLYANKWDGSRWAWETLGSGSSRNRVMDLPSVVSYRQGSGPQEIQVFFRASDGFFYSYYWNGSRWDWRQQGSPLDKSVTNSKNIAHSQARNGSQSIHSFWYPSLEWGNTNIPENIATNLYLNRSSRPDKLGRAQWMDQRTPNGAARLWGETEPSAISYRDAFDREKIYSFATGRDRNLYVNYLNGSSWTWANQGKPFGKNLNSSPTTVTYVNDNRRQVIYTYVTATNDIGIEGGFGWNAGLYTNYWDGSRWRWEDLGKPSGVSGLKWPEAMSYQDPYHVRHRNVYVVSARNELIKHKWDSQSGRTSWLNYGSLYGEADIASPTTSVTFINEDKVREEHSFFIGSDRRLYELEHTGSNTLWADHAYPYLNQYWVLRAHPSAITFRDGNQKQRILVFVMAQIGNLVCRFFDGERWRWLTLGTPGRDTDLDPHFNVKAITFSDAQQKRYIQVYTEHKNGERYMAEWIGDEFTYDSGAWNKWRWFNLGFRGFRNANRSMLVMDEQEVSSEDHTIYPNPFHDHISVTHAEDIKSIRLISDTGEILSPEMERSGGEISLDLSQLKSKYYTIQMETEHGLETQKILKVNN